MSPDRHIRNLAVIGFMATGKSTVGRLVARELRFDFVDTDALIESRLRRPIRAVFETEGEAWFRDYERTLVIELAGYDKTVIATGGGLPVYQDNLEQLKRHAYVICLWAAPEAIWRRARRHAHRPLLQTANPLERIEELLAARGPYYRQADMLVETEFRSVNRIVQLITYQFRSVWNPPTVP